MTLNADEIRIFGLKSCDTCRKAMKACPGAQLVDVRETSVPEDILRAALDAFGDALVNRKSTTWRGLDETSRALSPEVLVAAHPAVMKRPLVAEGDRLFLGWTDEVRRALGLA